MRQSVVSCPSYNMTMELLTKEEISKIAKKIAGVSEQVSVVDYELSNRSEETLGYLGKHLTLTVHLSTKSGNHKRRLFVKTYEVRNNKEDFLEETGIFKREQDFYKMVVEDVKQCVGEPDWCPEYHFSKERVLVLEDLSEKGFTMVKNWQGAWALDRPHLEAALKAVSSMHAASMLLERKQSKSLPVAYPMVFGKEVLYDEHNTEAPSRKWINWQIQDLLEGVAYLDKYSDSEKILIKNNLEKQTMRIYALSKKSEKYRNVLTHGDVWKNNLLFLYSCKGIPKNCRFVDFQFIRYAPPAHDVMHLLYYATEKQTRDQMQSYFLQVYYENLRKVMSSNGIDVEEEVKQEEFVESCTQYKELALVQCLLSLHYILGPVNLTVEAESYEKYEDYLRKHRKVYMCKFFQDETYARKITDIFYELIDTYILKQ